MNMMTYRQLPPNAQDAAIAYASEQVLLHYMKNNEIPKLPF